MLDEALRRDKLTTPRDESIFKYTLPYIHDDTVRLAIYNKLPLHNPHHRLAF